MSETNTANLAAFKQVALVVEDLDEGVRTWHERFGIGPWTAWRLGPGILEEMIYYGRPCEFSFRHALAWQGDVQFELVQPLEGPSVFADHLRDHGPGLHHLGMFVADHPAAVRDILAQGYEPIQSARGYGAEGDGAFAYFRAPGIPTIVELIEAPRVRIEPEFVYPS